MTSSPLWPVAAVVALLGCPATTTRAWGPEGHEIVARVAAERLTPTARRGVDDLLAARHNNGHGLRLWYSNVAIWADFVRGDRPETVPWHFVDIPYGATRYDPERDCHPHHGCVVESIHRFRAELADPHAGQDERMEALKFLVHFVGDIHQPLHCAERNDDHGGIRCQVLFPGVEEPTSLHQVWDSLLLEKTLGERHSLAIDFGVQLNRRITSEQARSWQGSQPEDWAMESHAVAVRNAYDAIPVANHPVPLNRSYVWRNQAVVNEQLMKAGVRLAELLNGIFH